MKRHFLFLILFTVHVSLWAAPEAVARRIQAHLLVGDPLSAVAEGESGLRSYPNDNIIYEWTIRSLAAAGREQEMMALWGQFNGLYPEKAQGQNLLEEMCWAILKKGNSSMGLSSQFISIVGAALTLDMRAVPFLLEGIRHRNAHVREISVELAAQYGDQPLRQELIRMFREETALEVRLAVIRALGTLRMEEFLPDLIAGIAHPKKGAREKLASIEAIILMEVPVSKEELEWLCSSKRAGLRQLASEVVAQQEGGDYHCLLVKLIQDPQAEVAAAALRTWGLLRYELTPEIIHLALNALDPQVGITAAWICLMEEPERGEKAIGRWLNHEHSHVRALAAAAIATSGPYGIPLAKENIVTSKDPFVRLNLALALAGQRESIDLVSATIEECLQRSEKWMFSENNLFKTLERNTLSHKSSLPNYPEVANQTARLELLNLLAILESPGALEAIKKFLKQRKWGVTGLAAELALGEGDEKAIDLVRELLSDPDGDIRIEAALALATWGKDFSATPTLLAVYPTADRQLKIKILESLGRIADRSTIPFLIDRLKEPSLLLRMIAASVLIQTLNG